MHYFGTHADKKLANTDVWKELETKNPWIKELSEEERVEF
jgi:hypothetical protein